MPIPLGAVLLIGLGSAFTASAASVSLQVAKPLRADTVTLSFTPPTPPRTPIPVEISIAATDSARDKAVKIRQKLAENGFTVNTGSTSTMVRISDLAAGTKVSFNAGKTGERSDSLTATDVSDCQIAWQEEFAFVDSEGLPAIFEAGVFNDLGAASITLSANEIAGRFGDLSATSVATALMQELVGQLPGGIELELAGSEALMHFDPVLTQAAGGGVIFGTTSNSGTVAGALTLYDSGEIFEDSFESTDTSRWTYTEGDGSLLRSRIRPPTKY